MMDEPIQALKMCAGQGKCRSCEQIIYWLKRKSGKPHPFNADGVSHFATCPNAEKHRPKPATEEPPDEGLWDE